MTSRRQQFVDIFAGFMEGGINCKLVVDVTYDLPVPQHVYNLDSAVMLQMETLWRQLNDKFLHREKSENLQEIANRYLVLAAKLKVLADQRLLELEKDKVRYAPHPNNQLPN